MTACTEYLEREGIRTLLFTGANIDQCVMGTLQDASLKGFDCIPLKSLMVLGRIVQSLLS